MANHKKNTQLGSIHLGITFILALIILGVLAYLFWINIVQPRLAKDDELLGSAMSLPKTFDVRHVPFTLRYSNEWELEPYSASNDQVHLGARVKGDQSQKVVFTISYSKRSPNTNPNPSKWVDGAPIKPRCPYEVSQWAPAGCKLLTNEIAGGYLYSKKTGEGENQVRWQSKTKNEDIDVMSYEVNEATLGAIIKSMKSSSSRTVREPIVPSDALSKNDQQQNKSNADILSIAVKNMDIQECNRIKGITYQTDYYQKDKVRVYEEWQTIIDCRLDVQQAVKKNKALNLIGDDCSQLRNFPNLRRVLENVKVVSANDGRVALVTTKDGDKTVRYAKDYFESSTAWSVDTTCQSSSHKLKAGDVINVYVPKNDNSPSAYENNTRVVQKVNLPE